MQGISQASPCAADEDVCTVAAALREASAQCDPTRRSEHAVQTLQSAWPQAAVLVCWSAHRPGSVYGEGFDFWAEVETSAGKACAYVQHRTSCAGDAGEARGKGHADGQGAHGDEHATCDAAQTAAAGTAGVEVVAVHAASDETVAHVLAAVADAAAQAPTTDEGKAPAVAAYYRLMQRVHFRRSAAVFWADPGMALPVAARGDWETLLLRVRPPAQCPSAGAGASAAPPAAAPATVLLVLFSPRAPPLIPDPPQPRLILAPTASGKSTWRWAAAPVYCPEGELLDGTAFRYAYHRGVPRSEEAWLTGAGGMAQVFTRNLVLAAEWLRQDRRRCLTFNCSGAVLDAALAERLLLPEECVVVAPPAALHRRNAATRRGDPSLSDWDRGPGPNCAGLVAAARRHRVAVCGSFAAAVRPGVWGFVRVRDGAGVLAQPVRAALFATKVKADMLIGRSARWLDAPVPAVHAEDGADRAVWLLTSVGGRTADVQSGLTGPGTGEGVGCGTGSHSAGCEPARATGHSKGDGTVERPGAATGGDAGMGGAHDGPGPAYVLKSRDGFLLAKSGCLISPEDPYQSPAFWRWCPSEDGALRSATGTVLHITRLRGLPTVDPAAGPWLHTLPVDRMTFDAGAEAGAGAGAGAAILWYAGSFAPFHQGHLDCVAAVRHALAADGVSVAAAYVHPHPARSLRYKALAGPAALLQETGHRLAIAERCLQDCPWAMVDPLNAYRDSGSNLEALLSLRARLAGAFAFAEARGLSVAQAAACAARVPIYWVLGDDSFPGVVENVRGSADYRKGLEQAQAQGIRLCVVHNRPEQRTELPSGREGGPLADVLEVDAAAEFCGNRSATVVRSAWESGAGRDELSVLVGHASAADYLCGMRPQAL